MPRMEELLRPRDIKKVNAFKKSLETGTATQTESLDAKNELFEGQSELVRQLYEVSPQEINEIFITQEQDGNFLLRIVYDDTKLNLTDVERFVDNIATPYIEKVGYELSDHVATGYDDVSKKCTDGWKMIKTQIEE
ncbi:MAG: phasin family protein [Patescibacteria group bacterium]|jgi:hypothetical protein